MTFTSQEAEACSVLVSLALQEDLGSAGDLTSQAIIPQELTGQAVFVARRAGVLAGLPAVRQTCASVDATLVVECLREDGARLQSGDQLAIVRGRMRSILMAERTALNFVQRLSGIATLTRRYVDAVAGLPCRILDTRKTTPGWRLLEKYAVRCGGGHNHRMGLYDGILIKDNHLAVLREHPPIGKHEDYLRSKGKNTPIWKAVDLAVQLVGDEMPVEIEVDDLTQLEQALGTIADIYLLDNMTLEQLRQAVKLRNETIPDPAQALLEASGGVNLDTVRGIAETGVDRISVGALTHSAPALDIALDYLP